MFSLRAGGRPGCAGFARRDVLRVGALGTLGLGLPTLLRAETSADPKTHRKSPRATACILLFLQGGQSQVETFDLKPQAPAEVRGEFRPVATTVPGTQVCEHLPRLAGLAHRYALIRTLTHHLSNHNPAGYYTLSGVPPLSGDAFDVRAKADDHPNPGAAAARFRPVEKALPGFVQLSPAVVGDLAIPMPGQGAGFLGPMYDPLKLTADPADPGFQVDELAPAADVSAERLRGRRSLLRATGDQLASLRGNPAIEKLDRFYQRAFDLVTSPAARQAFALEQEPAVVRDRYGRHRPGQSLLLARRLVEAGVRLVTVYWGGPLNAPDDFWDTHKGNIPKQRDRLLPPFDQCLSALLADLGQRGLLETTLVVSLGEFGRTPKLGQVTGDNGTDETGRDHWPQCYSVLLAGGGVRGGVVIGRSDRFAAYPEERPVTPEDLLATIYSALGLDPEAALQDPFGRPLPLSRGKAVPELFG